MKLLDRLLHRTHGPEATASPMMVWEGQSGKQYRYDIFPIEADFRSLPGNFIYAQQTEDGAWRPIYIAQTRDLHQRLEGHVHTADAIQYGASHIHAHYDTAGQASRCSEERDLIARWLPVCNEKPQDS